MLNRTTAARIFIELVIGIGEVYLLAMVGDLRPAVRAKVQHARELYDLLLEQLVAAELVIGKRPHGMAISAANKLFGLDALADEPFTRSALN